MLNITKQQAQDRFAVLPPTLQDAVFSVQNAEIISSIGEQYNIPEEKTEDIAGLAGWVLLGFLHPEDLPKEIVASANLPQQIANDATTSLINKIFAPIKTELDKAYAPLPHEQEINEPQQISAAPVSSTPAPKIISETFVATPKFGGGAGMPPAPVAVNRDIAAPAPVPKPMPKPATQPSATAPSDAGWSKATAQQPVVKFGTITSGVPKPTPVAQATSGAAPKTISMPTASGGQGASGAKPAARSMSEFERLDLTKKGLAPSTPTPPIPRQIAPAPAPKPAPATPPQPAPVMLHQVSSFAPIENSSSSFNTKKPAQDQLRGATAQGSMPSRPAVVEFGNADGSLGVPGRSTMPKSVAPTPTPPPSPMANTGPRQMTEIQAPAPSGTVPLPATPPKPPAPSTSASLASEPQKDKVIVKDFLGPQ